MLTLRRTWVACALSAYLLAALSVHFMHQHGDCHEHSAGVCSPATFPSTPHQHEGSPAGSCEDSCFACRFLAIQSLAPAIVAPAAVVAVVEPLPEPCVRLVAADRLSLPLTRGPPCA
jgi:hypothetical protein